VLETSTNLLANKLPSLASEYLTEIKQVEEHRGDLTVTILPEANRKIITHLKNACGFEMLLDVFAMDYLKYEPTPPERFAVIYNLYSLSKKRRMRIKTFVKEENPTLDSIHDIYASANWFEREAWDLFGIQFVGHPHLTRILCHQDFEGHPLRKDYPSDGYQKLQTAAPSSGI